MLLCGKNSSLLMVDLQIETGFKQKQDGARGPRLGRARGRIRNWSFATSSWKSAKELGEPVKIEEIRRIEQRGKNRLRLASKTVSGKTGGDERIVVRPDGSVMI